MNMTEKLSPNFNERKSPVDMLVLHYTETENAAEAIDILTDPARQVSAHYVVDINGTITRLVPEDKRAWHAGKSTWQGVADINSRSIGIEIQNRGHAAGCPPYPAIQIKAVIALCRAVIKRHNIPPQNILGHSDVAPGRKIDPGEHFPWKTLADAGIGRWPKGAIKDELSHEDLDRLLLNIGYDAHCTAKDRRRAFFMHFYPEGLKDEQSPKTHRAAISRAKKLADPN